MKVLIIGSKGFIGTHCVKHFNRLGHKVFEADVFPEVRSGYSTLQVKDTDFTSIFQHHKFDICINASGSAHVGFSFENPNVDFELNVLNVQKLMVSIRNHCPGCKFINFSSAAVYGNPVSLPIVEEAACKPLSPYGFHKLQSELLLAEYHKFFGLKTCSLRVFSAFGPGLKKQLFWDLAEKVKSQSTVKLFGSGNESRDFIYIDDLIQIVDLVIQKSTFEGNIFNVANGCETTISTAVTAFVECYSPKTEVVFSGESKIGDPNNWLADISKIDKLGYIRKIDFETGVNYYTEWLRELK